MNVLGTPLVAASSDTSAGRTRTPTDSGKDSDFDALLQAKPRGQAEQATSSPAAQEAGKPSREPTKPARTDDTDAEASAGNSATDTQPGTPDPHEPPEDAPWPPLGLSVMVPVAVEPAAATPAAVESPRTAAGPAAAPAIAGNALPAQMPHTAQPQAIADAQAQPPDDDAPLLAARVLEKAAATAAAGTDDDDDAPPTAFNPLLHAQAAQEVRAPGAARAIDAPTPTPDLESTDFDQAIGARVSWLAEQKIGHAHIRITPHDMGQVEVKLQLDGDRVHASFSSAHADVRQALENSLPRLREMLGEQGLQLAQADVGQHPQSQQHNGASNPASGVANASGAGSEGIAPAPNHTLRMRGLLDAYA